MATRQAPRTEPITAFVLSKNEDAAQVTRALRGAGYRVVDPVELDELASLSRDPQNDAREIVRRDLLAMMECDMIIMGPEAELQPWSVAVAAAAGTRGMGFERIEKLVPSWRQA